MKITTLLLFLAIMQVSANTLAQKVTLKANGAELSTIFQQIRSQTGYDFAYTTKTLENAKPVTINVKNEELSDVLQKIFDDQPLDFTIQDKFVTVTIKQPSLLDKLKSALNLDKIDIHGNVLDETGKPVPGATVKLKKSGNITITNEKGEFKFDHVDPNETLVITFIGFKPYEIAASADLSKIKLEVTNNDLDEVKVIAYGETSERLTVGNVNSISAKEIEQQPVTNPMLALEGQIPGLVVTQQSGIPGAGINVTIQGLTNISGGNDPLYVIDGVPYFSEVLSNLGPLSVNGGPSGSPLNYINPIDIESITILKDADATSIYGTRAANGAVLITTKKGKAGQTKVDVNLQQGWATIDHELNMMNTQEYIAMRLEGERNDGQAQPGAADYDLNGFWNTNSYTDWQKVLIGNTASYTNLNATVSGGTSNTQFLVGATYNGQTTVFPGDFSDDKAAVHFSINTASPNQKFHFQFTGSFMNDNNKIPGVDLTPAAILTSPDAPPLYNRDRTLNWANNSAGSSTFVNPLGNTMENYDNKTDNLISNMVISYNLLTGLDIRSSFGYTNLVSNEQEPVPTTASPPQSTNQAYNTFGTTNLTTWLIEPQLEYKRTIGKGRLDMLLGSTFQENNSNYVQSFAYGFASNATLGDILAAPYSYYNSDTQTQYRYNGYFGRINYNWEDKYIFDVSFNRDGSSRFGSANEFHDFYSVGGAWIFTQEKIVKDNLSFLSFGKFKVSYGTTGSDQIGDYQYLSLYYPVNNGVPYNGATGLLPTNIANPNLQWEETSKLNLGMDLGLFKDRILLTINYSRNITTNQLLQIPLPSLAGPGLSGNLPTSVLNSDLEFTLKTVNLKTKDFSWTTNFNLTPRAVNKIIDYPNPVNDPYLANYVNNHPINSLPVYHFLGVDPATGLYEFADSKGNPTTNPNFNTDLTKVENLSPYFYGGMGNTITYKTFELSFFLQVVDVNAQNFFYGYGTPGRLVNQSVSLLNHWQNPGDISSIMKFDADGNFGTNLYDVSMSDAAYSNAAYVRLKNASLSWNVPQNWLLKIGVQNARIFMQGQNLLTITKSQVPDPESGPYSLPPLRTMTIGIQATF